MSFEYWQDLSAKDEYLRQVWYHLTNHIPPTAVLFSTVEETNWPEFYLQLVFSANNSFLFMHEAKA